ncbi:MAG: transcriptional repressor [Bacteroidales bacterium]|jgi:Fe2+ or Zn2+ uptake regulation protein|nr:transcriptional repressor [Bacteroidales bacterium]
MDVQKEILGKLTDCGVKPSPQRMAIMQFLVMNPVHPTVEVVFNSLLPKMPTLSKTTVYNTLKLLSEHGAIQTIVIDEKNVRYDATTAVHAHFQCKQCGKVFDFKVKGLKDIKVKAKHFHITECQVYYKGLCEECNNQ